MRLQRVAPDDMRAPLVQEWSGLLDGATEPSVFLSPEWLAPWQRHFGGQREAFLLTARDGAGALVGLAPLYHRRLGAGRLPGPRVVSFLGDEGAGSEYLGVLTRPGAEEEFLSALARDLEGQWALADLLGLREGSQCAALLIRILGCRSAGRIHLERHPCAAIPLPSDYEAYLASLPRKFRTTVRYRTNKLTKNFSVRLVRTERQEEIDAHLQRLFEMHQERWRAEGHSGSFYHPRKRAFYREVASGFLRRGWLRFYHLEVDGVIRAAQFGFLFGGVLHSLQEAFDIRFRPQGVGGVGVVLRGLALQRSIEEGVRVYDFLGGEEEFKTRWGTTTHYVQHVRIAAPGLAGRLAYACTAELLDAKAWLREHLPRWVMQARDGWRTHRQARRARRWARRNGGPAERAEEVTR